MREPVGGTTRGMAPLEPIKAPADHQERLQKLYELSMTLSGNPIDIFRQIAHMIGELLGVKVVCLSEVRGDQLHFVSVYVQGDMHMNAGQCDLSITPCATVESSRDFRVYDGVSERFPDAAFLKDHNAYSYCGFPSLGSDGDVVAVTCLLDDQPHEFSDDDQNILRVFGQRIAVEIERQHHLDAQKEVAESIRHQASYQSLLAELSSQLIRARPADIGGQLDYFLERIGAGFELDSISLWWLTENRDGLRLVHRWESVDGSSPPNYRDPAEYPWLAERLEKGETAIVDDVEEMPPEAAAEQAMFRRWETKSFMMIPLWIDEDLEGTCAFSMKRKKRTWSTETVTELKLLTENLACAYARAEAAVEIQQLKEQLQKENLYLREEVRVAHGFSEIIGESPQLTNTLRAVEKVAPTDMSVLILGETGTGKELIARAVHELSARRDKPMISVNCPALPANLIESELFGHEAGAFTGAQSRRTGRFEQADGGTLFLDELGELPLVLQGKLLRVLQSGEFQRLGGTETLHSDVRLIAATNRDLKKAADEGSFRPDLYYRVSNFPLHLPTLRDRKDDIPLLAEHFVRKHAERLGKKVDAISSEMIDALMEYSWPGNIRELENVIERALISSDGHSILKLQVPPSSLDRIPGTETAFSGGEMSDLSTVERSHILDVLEETGWVIAGENGAASVLRVPPSTLRSKMQRLGISRDIV